ncbi:MAG: hypothetical protein K6T88_14595 [Bacillus sp. (in: Bacteria)]|nr:hypothetical protein [Bacillus sp. (in: firmicutes)]
MDLIWDGSYLGQISITDITELQIETSVDGNEIRRDPKARYYLIKINGKLIGPCLMKGQQSSFPCLIDEIKSIFRLPKLGTHQIKIGNNFCVIIQVQLDSNGAIIEEGTLKDAVYDGPENLLFRRKVQETFAFREILAVSKTCEKSIRLRTSWDGRIYPISFREPGMIFRSKRSIIPNTVIKKWFNDVTISQTIISMMKTQNMDLGSYLSEFRTKLEDIIHRVDRDSIWISSFIMDRLLSRLLDTNISSFELHESSSEDSTESSPDLSLMKYKGKTDFIDKNR